MQKTKTKTKTKTKNRLKGASMKQEIEDILQKSELSGRIYHRTPDQDIDRYSETFTIKFNADHTIDGDSIGDLYVDLRENKNLIYGILTRKLGSYGYIENYYKNHPTEREFAAEQVPQKLKKYLKKANKMIEDRKKEYKNIPSWEYKGTGTKTETDLFDRNVKTKVFHWYNEKRDLWVRVEHSDLSCWFAKISHKKRPLYSSQYETLAVENTKDLIIDATLKRLKKGDLPDLSGLEK